MVLPLVLGSLGPAELGKITAILAAGRTQANEPGAGCCTCLSRATPMDIGTLKDVHTLESTLVLRYLGLEWVTLTGVALRRGS